MCYIGTYIEIARKVIIDACEVLQDADVLAEEVKKNQ